MELATLRYSGDCWSHPFPALDSSRTLVLAFAAPSYAERGEVLAELGAAFPNSTVIGCSTAGEIDQTRIRDESVTVAAVRFAETRVRRAHARLADAAGSFAAGVAIAHDLAADDLRAVIVLSEGVYVNGSELVRGLNAGLPATVVVTGGLAGDGPRFARTWVLADGVAEPHAVVAVGLYGTALRVTHGSQGGWDAFGPERLVTASTANVLYELDGRPALTLYKQYLGERAADLPSSALLFPLALREEDGTNRVVRTVLSVDEANQSLTFAGDVPIGHYARLMRANFDRLILGAREAGQATLSAHDGPVLAIAISCVGRRLVLGERTEEETEAAIEALPAGTTQVGFYSYGEISPHATGRCDLHNQTHDPHRPERGRMTPASHPLLDRLLRRVGASVEAVPSLEAWRTLVELVARTYRDADQDRYTIERAIDVSSQEMQELYQELRRRGEQELDTERQANERHRLLFDGNPLPMWVLDAETLRFIDVNDAMIRTYGYTRDELLAMRAMDLKLPSELPDLLRAVGEALDDTITHVGLRRHRRKDGAIVDMDLTIHAIRFDGRRRILGIGLDMTQTRRVEEELRQAQKMEAIGRLAGGVAHDFNNLLAVIMANAEFTLAEVGPGHEAAVGIVEIQHAAERAAGLTRQLLTFSRKQQRKPTPLALNSIVTGIEAMLTRIVGEDIAMSAFIAPDLGTIEADPGEVEQILMNLVVNARDAMPTGGRLLLETVNTVVDADRGGELGIPAGRYVALSVSDSGCGMTEAVRVRIFEPFFTTKEVDKGTGLGLATVFGIVKECRGGIAVHSVPGEGSTFRIYWPRIDAPVAKQPTAPRVVPHCGSGTVLVVEDDAQLRQIVRRYLTSWGYTLLEAPNGAAALEPMPIS